MAAQAPVIGHAAMPQQPQPVGSSSSDKSTPPQGGSPTVGSGTVPPINMARMQVGAPGAVVYPLSHRSPVPIHGPAPFIHHSTGNIGGTVVLQEPVQVTNMQVPGPNGQQKQVFRTRRISAPVRVFSAKGNQAIDPLNNSTGASTIAKSPLSAPSPEVPVEIPAELPGTNLRFIEEFTTAQPAAEAPPAVAETVPAVETRSCLADGFAAYYDVHFKSHTADKMTPNMYEHFESKAPAADDFTQLPSVGTWLNVAPKVSVQDNGEGAVVAVPVAQPEVFVAPQIPTQSVAVAPKQGVSCMSFMAKCCGK